MSDQDDQGVYIFGRDIRKIPCFRNTFLYSISSYVGVSLVTFLLTSRPSFSSHCGFASFIAVTLGYYTNCRINYSRQKFYMSEVQQTIQKKAILEGSEEAEEILRNKQALQDA